MNFRSGPSGRRAIVPPSKTAHLRRPRVLATRNCSYSLLLKLTTLTSLILRRCDGVWVIFVSTRYIHNAWVTTGGTWPHELLSLKGTDVVPISFRLESKVVPQGQLKWFTEMVYGRNADSLRCDL